MSKPKLITRFTVYGEPASKANSRKLVTNKRTGKPMFIKSSKARRYVMDFQIQCRPLEPLIEDDVLVKMTIYYASRRPDLDESVILDAMQGYIYKNDRQVKHKDICWGLDRENPRADIEISLICQK